MIYPLGYTEVGNFYQQAADLPVDPESFDRLRMILEAESATEHFPREVTDHDRHAETGRVHISFQTTLDGPTIVREHATLLKPTAALREVTDAHVTSLHVVDGGLIMSAGVRRAHFHLVSSSVRKRLQMRPEAAPGDRRNIFVSIAAPLLAVEAGRRTYNGR